MINTNKFFEVFKQQTDHNKWKKQIEFAFVMDAIEENKRADFISAHIFLEK